MGNCLFYKDITHIQHLHMGVYKYIFVWKHMEGLF